jgi:hypothetical protein
MLDSQSPYVRPPKDVNPASNMTEEPNIDCGVSSQRSAAMMLKEGGCEDHVLIARSGMDIDVFFCLS